MKFIAKLIQSLSQKGHLCVGLDSRYDRIPIEVKTSSVTDTIFQFNTHVIEATHEYAAAYKMNVAFYAGFGHEGLTALEKTNKYLKKNYPDIPLLADCKRSEMGESVEMVRREIFEWLCFDCVMVTPWFGFDTIQGYLHDESNGVCVYVHDSNPTAIEFQDVILQNGKCLYEYVAERVAKHWNINGNVWVEGGATYPEQLRGIRRIVGDDMPILAAGIGPQGGKIEHLQGLFGTQNRRLLVNSSRGILFAGEGKRDYFLEVHNAAKNLHKQLQEISLK